MRGIAAVARGTGKDRIIAKILLSRLAIIAALCVALSSCNRNKIEPGEVVEWNLLVEQNINVELNPTGRNFLAAEVSFETTEECAVSVSISGGDI